MTDFDKNSKDKSAAEEKISYFTHAGTIQDPSLNQLRDQIKKVMIPLLIKTFQLKLELNQSLSLPSRIQNLKQQTNPEEIIEQLKQLDKDLKVLWLWCENCRGQIQKAFTIPEEEQKNTIATTNPATTNPAVSKSFTENISQNPTSFAPHLSQIEPPSPTLNTFEPPLKKKWWQFLKNR